MYGIGYSLFNSLTFLGARGGSVDPDAQAFITAASITDPTQQSAVNQLVVDLKAANIWTKMKAVYPFVGGSASSHKWNLVNPVDSDAAFRLSFSGGWTHNSNGAKANGSNASALTHFVHNAQLPDYKISFGTVRDQYTNGMIIGADSFRHYEWIGTAITMGTTVGGLYGGEISNGRVIMSRSASNNFQYFANGVKTNCANNVTGSASTQFELASFLGIYADARFKFCFIGENLNDTEASNLDTAMSTFNTTLGR